jgi:hypothetical protein
MLGLFHISKEVGKVHDAGGIGIAKFNASLCFEDLWHGPGIGMGAPKKRPAKMNQAGLIEFQKFCCRTDAETARTFARLIAFEWKQSHEAGSFDRFGNRVLTDRGASRFPPPDDSAMPIDQFL